MRTQSDFRVAARPTTRRRLSVARVSPTLESLERRELLSVDLTEGNAAAWGAFASDGAATTLSNDTAHVKAGSSSLHLRTESGFDTGVRYPAAASAHWDLRADNVLSFWVY